MGWFIFLEHKEESCNAANAGNMILFKPYLIFSKAGGCLGEAGGWFATHRRVSLALVAGQDR
jgi:hypothetical protein